MPLSQSYLYLAMVLTCPSQLNRINTPMSQSYLYLAMVLTFLIPFLVLVGLSQSYLYLAMVLTKFLTYDDQQQICRSPTST